MAANNEDALQTLTIERGEVHVWRFAFAPPHNEAWNGVRSILATYIGVDPLRIEFQQTRRGGRPILAPGLSPGLSFNLAHSARLALLAVVQDTRVGVDVERIRRGVRVDDVIRRFFAQPEIEQLLSSVASEDREATFFRVWVRKEAYLKAAGGGVPAGLHRFSVSVAPDEPPAILHTDLEPGGASAFSLYDIDVPTGYMGALAVEGTGHRIRYFDNAGHASIEMNRQDQ